MVGGYGGDRYAVVTKGGDVPEMVTPERRQTRSLMADSWEMARLIGFSMKVELSPL